MTKAHELVHQLTNQLQVVLSHLELSNYEGAMKGLRDAIGILNRLRAAVKALMKEAVP